MKAIVEWGRPKAMTQRKICCMSGQFIVSNPTQARRLAHQLFHSFLEGQDNETKLADAWAVSREEPRKAVWANDNSFFVAVSLLDGVARGPYAGVPAETDYRLRVSAERREEVSK